MTPYDQNEFIARLLHDMHFTLSNREVLKSAIKEFTNGKPEDPRYHACSGITNGETWLPEELLQFNAAYFQALAKVSEKFSITDPTFGPHKLNQFTKILKESYLPKITAHIKENQRIPSVVSNINTLLKTEFIRFPVPEEYKKSSINGENPCGFFAHPVTIGVALTAATVGLAMFLGSSS